MKINVKILTLLLIFLIIFPPYTSFTSSLPINYRDRDILLGIDSKSMSPRFSIIYKNGEGYLFITSNILYPLKDIPQRTLLGRKIGILSNDVIRKIPLRFIIKYNSGDVERRLINIIPKLGGKILYVYKYLPFISVELPLENASLPVMYGLNIKVSVDYKVKVMLNESVPMIKNPSMWSKLESEYGHEINGSGVVIGILDTGIDGSHPDFYFPNGTCKIIINMSMVPNETASDGFGHGTHVAGIAAGTGLASHGKFIGMAPGAWLANIKVLSNKGFGYTSWIIRGIETAVEDGVDVINLSLGGGENGDGSDPLSIAVDWAFSKGVVVVVAAGNNGPKYSTLGSPAVAKKAITVGAVSKNYKIASFSSRGPTGDGRVKPEVVAPGVDIVAPIARDSILAKEYSQYLIHGEGGDYLRLSGTSMATPHVTGLVALVIQAHPNWSAEEIREAVISSADPLGYDEFTEGAGLVNAYKAVKRSIEVRNVTFSKLYVRSISLPASINISLSSLDNNTHYIESYKLMSRGFYNPSISINNAFSVDIPSEVSPESPAYLKIRIIKDIPFGIYEGKIILSVDDGMNYSIIFSILKVLIFEVNATYNGKYFDTLFFLYNKEKPDEWIMPTGYKSSFDNVSKTYNYTEWFYLYPGDYVVYGLSMNTWMGNETVPGVIFIYSDDVSIEDNVYRQFEYIKNSAISIPNIYDGRRFDPVAQIYGFYSSDNTSLIIYQFGLWNLSSPYKLYNDLKLSTPIYLNLQYINVPPTLVDYNRGSWYPNIDSYLSSSWVINNKTISLSLANMTKYTLNTASTKVGCNSYGGYAIFPPKQNYTYVLLGPLYQGLNYTLYSDSLKYLYPHKLHDFRLFIGLNKSRSDSFTSIINPSYPGRELTPLKPPYTVFTDVTQGEKNGRYLNISMFLTSSLNPPQFPARYRYIYNVSINGNIINSSKGEGEILLNLNHYKYIQGVYRIELYGSSDYPLYNRVYSIIQFSTSSNDIEPPTINYIDLDPVIKGDEVIGYILVMDNVGVKTIDIKGIWDHNIVSEASVEKLRSIYNGNYNFSEYMFMFPVEGSHLDIGISLTDASGNIHKDIYYNAALKQLNYPHINFTSYLTPKYVEPGGESYLIIKSLDNNLYGFEVFVNNSFIGYLGTSGKEYASNITIKVNDYGSYNIEMYSHPLYYAEGYRLSNSLISTVLLVKSFIPYPNRVSAGLPVEIGVKIVYKYNDIPASGVTVVINGSKYITDDRGYATFKYEADNVGEKRFVINDVYCDNNMTKIHTFESPSKVFNVVFDRVYIESLNSSSRVDIGKKVKYYFNAVYLYDKTPFIGKITFDVNGHLYNVSSSGDGVYKLEISSDRVGMESIKIENIHDSLYNVSIYSSNFNSLNIVFDEVIINLKTSSPKIVEVGTNINISYSAYYAFDHEPFEGRVYIEPYPYTSKAPGLVTFHVTKINDEKYGLTAFQANKLKIFFDTIKIDIDRMYSLGKYSYIISIKYYSTGEYASGAVYINGIKYETSGKVKYDVTSISPFNKLDIKVDVPGFREVEKIVVDYNYFNILIYILSFALIVISIVFVRRRRLR